MDPEMNTENWNDDWQTQNQENPCKQPQVSSFRNQWNQWLQRSWFNVKVSTWLKCLIIIAVLTTAAFIAPRSSSAENKQNSTGVQAEEDWYYEAFGDDYGYEYEEDCGYYEKY